MLRKTLELGGWSLESLKLEARSLKLGLCGLAFASVVGAQGADTTKMSADSMLARARQLSLQGKDAEGRKIIDTLLTMLTPDSAKYGDALYARGTMASTAVDAERDYRRLLIETPVHPRVEDALLQLAQLEQARGDRRGASDHLQRYLLSYPEGSARARVSVQLVRLLFDMGPQQLARACDALRSAKNDVPSSQVELRNQLEAQAPRCAYVDAQPVAPAVPVDSVAPAASAPVAPPTTPVDTATKPAVAAPPVSTPPAPTAQPTAAPAQTTAPAQKTAPPQPQPTPTQTAAASTPPATPAANEAFYSVQVAAYTTQQSATRFVEQLASRGVEARVDATETLFRVRVGKYKTRAEAVKMQADLKAKGHDGFITLTTPR